MDTDTDTDTDRPTDLQMVRPAQVYVEAPVDTPQQRLSDGGGRVRHHDRQHLPQHLLGHLSHSRIYSIYYSSEYSGSINSIKRINDTIIG